MPDPTGTIGMAPQRPNDIDIALAGGDAFMARVKQLGEARISAANALAELKLGEAAKSAFEKASQMKAAAEEAVVKAGQEVFDAARKVEEARVQAKAIVADADKRSAEADKRLASAEQAEQELMKNRAVVRAAEKTAAAVKKKFETKLAKLHAGLNQFLAEDAHDERNFPH
jgi:hypothetical protein